MLSEAPNARFDHVFVVLRFDEGTGEPEEKVTVTKVFASEAHARAEAQRLNAENASRGTKYVVKLGRMSPKATTLK